jgi:hypothetical protein
VIGVPLMLIIIHPLVRLSISRAPGFKRFFIPASHSTTESISPTG